jgi:serine/threonine protein kinase
MKKVGRYVIISELGRGAMGVVYKASDPTSDREVALKVLSLSASPDEGTNSPQEMFMREVRAAGRLAHPSIVTIYDAFDEPVNQTSCIVMELVPGVTLEKMLDSGKPPTIEQSLNLIRQVAEALDYAHRNKVIHRDLKPANILVTDDGRAKITDFGIAKVLAREGVARTIGIMGTPSYMSPEQVRGGEIDARTDIFSLGIMIFTMMTGQKPFAGNTAAVMFKIVYEEPAVPSSVNPQLTSAHDYVVKKCLAKDRNQRYSSARELLNDVDDLQHGRPPRSQAGAPAAAPPAPPAVAPPTDHTPVVPTPVLNKATVKPQAPRTPPATPLRVEPQTPRPPSPPPAAPVGPRGPVPSIATDPTVAMPIPELKKSVPQPPSPQPVSAPPASPPVPVPPPQLVVPLPVKPAPDAQPLIGKTLVMRVPDLSAISSSPASPPRGTPVRPAPPDSPLMERTLPMRVPDLSAVSLPGSSSPHTESVRPPSDSPLMGRTLPMQVPDLSAVSPPVPSSSNKATVPAPPRDFPSSESERTIQAEAPDITVASPAAGPQLGIPAPLPPTDAAHTIQPEETPGEVLPAPKSKLFPVMVGVAAVLFLAIAVLGYWKFHKSRAAPSTQEALITQTVIPPQSAAPAVTSTPPPAVPVEPPPPQVSAAPEVTKKTGVRKAKQAIVPLPAPSPPPPQPEPVVVAPPPTPLPSTPSPADIAKAEAAKLANTPRIINVVCNFGLKEATFTFSAGGKTLYQETEKGKKKKAGFLGIKGSYEGTFSHTLTVPAGVSQVSLHVESKDGSTDLSNAINMPPPGGFVPTLAVQVDNDHLLLNWKGSSGAL